MKPTFLWETYSKNRQTPEASPFGAPPITTPTKENDSDCPWKVLPILNNDLYSVSWLLAYSSMNVEDIFPWHHLRPGGRLKEPDECGECYFSGHRFLWRPPAKMLAVEVIWQPPPWNLCNILPLQDVNNRLQSPNLQARPALQAFSGNASFNVHSILMFVRSDSRAVWGGGLTEDTRRAA